MGFDLTLVIWRGSARRQGQPSRVFYSFQGRAVSRLSAVQKITLKMANLQGVPAELLDLERLVGQRFDGFIHVVVDLVEIGLDAPLRLARKNGGDF